MTEEEFATVLERCEIDPAERFKYCHDYMTTQLVEYILQLEKRLANRVRVVTPRMIIFDHEDSILVAGETGYGMTVSPSNETYNTAAKRSSRTFKWNRNGKKYRMQLQVTDNG